MTADPRAESPGGDAPSSEGLHRTFLHVDMDAFFVSVELLRRPELRGRPVVVGGRGRRGVVAAASYEARAHGVFSAMPSLRAQRLCPDAVWLPGDHAHYAAVSDRVMAVFERFTPFVEPLSLDEAFLDVTGARRLHGSGVEIAHRIRRQVLDEEGLTCSVGVSAVKFVAKMATETAKPSASPRGPVPGAGVHEVAAGEERVFLAPHPVRALWGVGPKTFERLRTLGIGTIGDLAAMPQDRLRRVLGPVAGAQLHRLANGIDERGVSVDRTPKSIGHEETFAEDFHDRSTLHVELVRMADAVARRARAQGLPGRTVTIKVRFGDFRTITRSSTSADPVVTGPALVRVASALLDGVDIGDGVRLLGVTLSNLAGEPAQLSLDDLADPAMSATAPTGAAGWAAVTDAIDELKDRFGDDVILPATLAGRAGLRAKRPSEQLWGPGSDVGRPTGGTAAAVESPARGVDADGRADDGDGRVDDDDGRVDEPSPRQ